MSKGFTTVDWNGHAIHLFHTIDGWWMFSKDVCDALGLKNKEVSRRLRKDQEEDNESSQEIQKYISCFPMRYEDGSSHDRLVVTEKGVQKIALHFPSKETEDFQEWACSVFRKVKK